MIGTTAGGESRALYETPIRREVIVVGGGQAGLAIGYFLARQGRRFTILEAAAEPAGAWRARWDSLRLFTPVRYDSLPGMPFPGDPDTYPRRDDVGAYLTDYAREFALPVELNRRVRAVRQAGGGYHVDVEDRTYEAEQVVIATGPFQVPFVPPISDRLAPEIVQLHSAGYRSPVGLPPGPALVVGGGNTGFQIAAELAGTREVHLSIGSRQTPLPQRLLGRDLFRFLEGTGLMDQTATSRLGRRMKDRDVLIGSSPRSARRHGIRIRPRASDAGGPSITFADGTDLSPRTVVWATGFRLDHSFVEVPVFGDRGQVLHERGVTSSPGLYFLGLPWQHTRGSALLGWVKDDAQYLAGRIDALRSPPAPCYLVRDGVRQPS